MPIDNTFRDFILEPRPNKTRLVGGDYRNVYWSEGPSTILGLIRVFGSFLSHLLRQTRAFSLLTSLIFGFLHLLFKPSFYRCYCLLSSVALFELGFYQTPVQPAIYTNTSNYHLTTFKISESLIFPDLGVILPRITSNPLRVVLVNLVPSGPGWSFIY